jgi:rRNA maturation protein Nop10
MADTCNHCGGPIFPKYEESCPKCGRNIATGEPAPTLFSPKNGHSTSQGISPLRAMIARRSRGGIFVGIAIAAWGYFGGSYQRRGAGYSASGTELIWIGLAVAVFATIVYLLSRSRSPKN